MTIWDELTYIKPTELKHPDQVDPVVLRLADRMRQLYGEPFFFTSDGRDPAANKAAGGADTSLHLFDPAKNRLCMALDFGIRYAARPKVWEQLERMDWAWRQARDLTGPRGTELEIVYSEPDLAAGKKGDKHFHLGVFPDGRPHRLIIRPD